jgi:hypothetical protein
MKKRYRIGVLLDNSADTEFQIRVNINNFDSYYCGIDGLKNIAYWIINCTENDLIFLKLKILICYIEGNGAII